jgi:peptide-methionine (S)-S-oxide reductase
MNKITVLLVFIVIYASSCAQKSSSNHSNMDISDKKYELATFGGGCFWCVEAIFERVDGVIDAISGYAGGTIKNPSYKEVCKGTTGHAEVVQLKYDSEEVSYEALLDIFFHTHNPTTLNQQGNDTGTQYRSIILYHSEDQKNKAEKYIKEANTKNTFGAGIVTEIKPFDTWYEAESYHQDYFMKNPNQPYCSYIIRPKVEKFELKYTKSLKDD